MRAGSDATGVGFTACRNSNLLAMAFLPTGLVKATNQRFTVLPVEHPVGFFFEAMYQTGPYWIFIGLAQVAAAVLLLIPATATRGAVMFIPICLSIFLITWGVGFAGTVYVTAAVLLVSVYLLCRDADRIWSAASLLGGLPMSFSILNRSTSPVKHRLPLTQLWRRTIGKLLTHRDAVSLQVALRGNDILGSGCKVSISGASEAPSSCRLQPAFLMPGTRIAQPRGDVLQPREHYES